jgi:pectate lyase
MKSGIVTHRVFLLNPKKLLIVFLVFSLAFFFVQQKIIRRTKAAGNAFYVATNGNDSRPGTESRPWKTIQKAPDMVVAGDTTYVREGTYDRNSGTLAEISSSIPAFPGAEGGGAAAIGGRGGRVIEVTNLDDSGPGSLRAACEASGPRIVIFRVGGIIELRSSIIVRNPYITIAGQTAPGGGILVSGKKMARTPIRIYNTHDIIIRFIRVRTGRGGQSGQAGDCIALYNNCYNVLIDHCSVSWSNDENMQVWANSGPSHDITFSWNLIAEGLTFDHASCGLIIGSDNNAVDMTNIDIHHNLFMHNQKRNPLVKGKTSRIINNIIYNWEWWASGFAGGITIDIIGNLYRRGPDSSLRYEVLWRSDYSTGPDAGPPGDPSIYIQGNIGPHQSDLEGDNWVMIEEAPFNQGTGHPPDRAFERHTPISGSPFPITVHSVLEIEDMILDGVGASMRLDEYGNWIPNRDAVDERLIQEYLSGTGIIPYDENSVGGFPTISPGTPYQDSDRDGMADDWELAHFGALDRGSPDDSGSDFDGDGYTDLEEYLNGTNPKGNVPAQIFLPFVSKGSRP